MPAPDVNPTLTSNRPGSTSLPTRLRRRSIVENDDYAAFLRRAIAAHGRRIATGDVEALPTLTALADTIDQALTVAVHGLRANGYSWSEIAERLGTTRQAAHQRWATPTPASTQGGAA